MKWTLIRNGEVFDPDERRIADVLIVEDRIASVGQDLPIPSGIGEGEVFEASGNVILPGLIDGHLHVMGASGMGGPTSRTPDLQIEYIAGVGVTTVVSPLGADSLSRRIETLLARAAALEAEGLTAYCYTGGWQYPVPTLTGNPQADVAYIDRVVGIKLAISERIAPYHSLDDLSRLAYAAYTGGRLAGKRAVLHVHVGDQPEGLRPLQEVQRRTGIPADRLVAAHVSRNPHLWRQALAYAGSGGSIDLTALQRPDAGYPDAILAHKAILEALVAGVPAGRITLSSDTGAAYPRFDAKGNEIGQYLAGPGCLLETIQELHRQGLSWGQAVAFCTSHVADVLGLARKGYLRPGRDADLVMLGDTGTLKSVMARGRFLVRNGQVCVRGTFSGGPAG